jgi:uncharacterized protein YggT (Ycf19 family)
MVADSAPALGILIDLPLGVLMWACLLRFLLTVFIKEDSKLGPMRALATFTSPVMAAVRFITPNWIIERIAPLYAAIVLMVLRYYLFPMLVGYDVLSFTNMPLESMILSVYFDFFG